MCVYVVSFGWTDLPPKTSRATSASSPSIQKFGQQGAPAHERPSPPPPGTGLAARSASVASHTALFAQPQRAVRCRAHPAPAPLFRLCTGWPPTR